MGKRKKGKKLTVQKRIYKIPKIFPCPFCNDKESVVIQIDRKAHCASLECRRCGASDSGISTRILPEPIDVYDDWVDRARIANSKYSARAANAKVNFESNDFDHDDFEEVVEHEEPRIRPAEPQDVHDVEVSTESDLSDSEDML